MACRALSTVQMPLLCSNKKCCHLMLTLPSWFILQRILLRSLPSGFAFCFPCILEDLLCKIADGIDLHCKEPQPSVCAKKLLAMTSHQILVYQATLCMRRSAKSENKKDLCRFLDYGTHGSRLMTHMCLTDQSPSGPLIRIL